MGQICCRPSISYSKADVAFTNSMIEEVNEPNLDIGDLKNLELSAEINLPNLIKEDFVKTLFDQIYDYINNPDIKKNDKMLIDEKLPLFMNDFKFWANLKNQEYSDTKLHTYYYEMEFPFTPELLYLYFLNEDTKNFEKLHSDLDQFEIVHQSFKQNYCFLLLKYRTRSVIMIEPANFFVLRVIMLNKDETLSEFQISINETHLKKIPVFNSIYESLENEGTIYLNGTKFEPVSTGYIYKSFVKMDVNYTLDISSIRSMIKKELLRKKNTLMNLMVEFILNEKDLSNLKWFSDSLADKKRIINKNLQILEQTKINLKYLKSELHNLYLAKFSRGDKYVSNISNTKELDQKKSDEKYYDTFNSITETNDETLIYIFNKIDKITKELKNKIEDFRRNEIEQKLNASNNEIIESEIDKDIKVINMEIDKRITEIKETLERDHNEGIYVEDMQKKVDRDLQKLSERLNIQLKNIIKKNIGSSVKSQLAEHKTNEHDQDKKIDVENSKEAGDIKETENTADITEVKNNQTNNKELSEVKNQEVELNTENVNNDKKKNKKKKKKNKKNP